MTESNYWQRRYKRRRILQASGVGAAGVAAAAVVGCGDDDDADAPAATPTAAPTNGEARSGGSLAIHDNGDPASFDYIKTWSYRTMLYAGTVYPRLLKFDTSPGVGPIDFAITTDLATSMPEQVDEATYVFTLQPAQWEDKDPLNGRDLTTEDVERSWERFNTEHPSRLVFKDIDRVEAPDDSTVTFHLREPLGPFVNHIGHQGYFYIHPHELVGDDRLEQDMWSAGPFLFDRYQIGADITFKRNPNYFQQGRPYLDEVVWKIVPDTSTTISALRTGQLDTLGWTGAVGPRDVASLERDLPGATFLPYPTQGNAWLGFDLTDPPFNDKRVRQAVSIALNRDDLIAVGVEGLWALPYGALTQWYFSPKDNEFPNARYYHHDLSEARAMLDAATGGDLPEFTLIGSDVWTPTQLQQTELTQSQLADLGIRTTFRQLPFAEYYAETVIGGRWSGGLAVSANLVGADPNEYFATFWDSESPRLISPGLGPLLDADTELTTAIERQRRTIDVDERSEAIREVVDIMADRMYNVPTTIGMLYHVHQANVHMNWIFTYTNEYLVDAWKDA